MTIDASNPSPDGKKLTITATGPDIAPLLKDGKVDYAFEYSSGAIQNGLKYITLPVDIDLSSQDPKMVSHYGTVYVKRSATATDQGMPIVYAVTTPVSARNPEMAYEFIKLLTGSEGQAVLTADGQTPIVPAVAYFDRNTVNNIPEPLRSSVKVIP
jgi:ABC-type molybdate transport system substrate-binding protein